MQIKRAAGDLLQCLVIFVVGSTAKPRLWRWLGWLGAGRGAGLRASALLLPCLTHPGVTAQDARALCQSCQNQSKGAAGRGGQQRACAACWCAVLEACVCGVLPGGSYPDCQAGSLVGSEKTEYLTTCHRRTGCGQTER